MATVAHAAARRPELAPPSAAAVASPGNKRKRLAAKGNKGGKSKKKKSLYSRGSDEPGQRRRSNKPSAKFVKLLQKRARDYNSDDDEEEKEETEGGGHKQEQERERPPRRLHDDHDDDGGLSGEDEEEEAASSSGDEAGGGGAVTRFEEGCRAFRVAFRKIMAKKLPADPLGPILSAHKTLVAAKLAEEVEEHKPKGETRKEKHAAAEKGHVLPKDHLDTHDKELMKIATQGVVRLFNAVSKAQKPRKDLNPSSTRDAKVLAKERKKTFLEELAVTSHQDKKGQASSRFSKAAKDEDEPGWAPLRDTYMLGSKLKDWDKMQDTATEQTKAPLGVSSDEE